MTSHHSDRFVASSSVRGRLLLFCEAQYQAIHLRQPDGLHIGKGIRLARDALKAVRMHSDAASYLDSLKRALLDEKRRIRGTNDDDPYGWALGGVQTVVNEVEKEVRKIGGA